VIKKERRVREKERQVRRKDALRTSLRDKREKARGRKPSVPLLTNPHAKI